MVREKNKKIENDSRGNCKKKQLQFCMYLLLFHVCAINGNEYCEMSFREGKIK